MSTAKHTPGPWFANFEAGRYVITYQGAFGPYRALAITGGFHPDHEGNARLIAAAPELLEALTAATDALAGGLWDSPTKDEHELCNEVIDACRAAIAKATGGE